MPTIIHESKTKEEIYDTEIAPLLEQVYDICEKKGLIFLCCTRLAEAEESENGMPLNGMMVVSDSNDNLPPNFIAAHDCFRPPGSIKA